MLIMNELAEQHYSIIVIVCISLEK